MTRVQAPGEAEAELSELNTRGIVDAVLTDDSDVLLFNARTVIRKWVANIIGCLFSWLRM